MDKFISFMTASNNLMNSNTKYPKLDKLTKSFSRLYNSDGMRAVLHFWNLWVNVWYIIDSLANIFRAYETRSLNAIDSNQPQPPNPLEDLQQSLDDANNNVAVVSDLIQQLTRIGEFDDGSNEQQDDDHESYVMQMAKRRLLQDVPRYKKDITGNHENHEKLEKDGNIYSVRQLINRRENKEQRLAVEKNLRLFYPVGDSSISADNRKDRGAIVDVIDHSTYITRTRRSKQIAVDKSRKRKPTRQKTLISSESALNATSKRSISIESGRSNFDVERSTNRSKHFNLQFNFAADRFIYFMAQANNVLNSNTNNVELNRFTRAFIDLFDSDGLIAFNTFYNLLASFLTIVDSVANLFRFNQARIRDEIQQQQAAGRPSPLMDLQSALNNTNVNVAVVAELISILQNGTAVSVESGNAKTDKDVHNHHAEHEKKNHHSHLSLEGKNHRVHTSPSPNQTSFSHQERNKGHPSNIPETFSPVGTKTHIHIESGGWIPITESSQPLVKTNRNFYYPIN
ncbi:hypothetical protein GHT06_012972 [Daphnia sinensis]|uniref:Uncharacterized protein n=1 Tax=Daphnia sinensis TaxID=1820382 RepID=A0AAD5LQB2_9CRUS|nr:hypothetical protein GHT06_012972 [Daphnia sinensis]